MDTFLIFVELISDLFNDNFLNKKLGRFAYYRHLGTAGKTVINLFIITFTALIIIGIGVLITKL